MFDNSRCFEPTFTLNGTPILPRGCQAPIAQGKAEAFGCGNPPGCQLGVRRREAAFWGYKREKAAISAAFFSFVGFVRQLVHKEGNGWKERKEETDTGVHTGRPPHIIEGTERPVPAFEQPVTGETEAGEEEED